MAVHADYAGYDIVPIAVHQIYATAGTGHKIE
jgi:hypothetical protein